LIAPIATLISRVSCWRRKLRHLFEIFFFIRYLTPLCFVGPSRA
jgi:hypothetical protein